MAKSKKTAKANEMDEWLTKIAIVFVLRSKSAWNIEDEPLRFEEPLSSSISTKQKRLFTFYVNNVRRTIRDKGPPLTFRQMLKLYENEDLEADND